MAVFVDYRPFAGADGMPPFHFKNDASLSARGLLFRGPGLCHSRQFLDDGFSVGEMAPGRPFGRWHESSHLLFDHRECRVGTVKHFLAHAFN